MAPLPVIEASRNALAEARRSRLPVLAVQEPEAWLAAAPRRRGPRPVSKEELRARAARGLPIVDEWGRELENLRVSVCHACNLACTYCHAEGQQHELGRMSPEEIGRVVRIAAKFGARKVKITGGEPLLRHDLADIIRQVRPHVEEVSMTTNGVFLAERAAELRAAGLDRVNVSIDTLEPARFAAVRGSDVLPRVLDGVEAARRAGLSPVRVNMVVQASTSEEELGAMLHYAARKGLGMQLIELHGPRGIERSPSFRASYRSLEPLERRLREAAVLVTVRRMHARPTYTVRQEGAAVPVEVVRPYRNAKFCAHCTRLRLTSDGELKSCLMRADNHVDVLGPMRRGAGDEELEDLFLEANLRREPYWAPGETHA